MGDEEAGTEGFEFGGWAEAPCDADGEHACGGGGFHVGAGVADEGDGGRGEVEGGGDFECGCWVGFARDGVALAEDRVEVVGDEVVGDALEGEVVRFVREDCNGDVSGGEGAEGVVDALVGLGFEVPAAGVGDLVEVEDGGGGGGVVLEVSGEDALDEDVHAVADEGAVGFDWVGGEACGGEGFVGGVGEVVECVEEGSVEVEDSGVERRHGDEVGWGEWWCKGLGKKARAHPEEGAPAAEWSGRPCEEVS